LRNWILSRVFLILSIDIISELCQYAASRDKL
jgi:hypothetical protein